MDTTKYLSCPTCGSNDFSHGYYSNKCNHCGTEVEIPGRVTELLVKPINIPKEIGTGRATLDGSYTASGPGMGCLVKFKNGYETLKVGMNCVDENFTEFRIMSSGPFEGMFYVVPIDPTITLNLKTGSVVAFTQ